MSIFKEDISEMIWDMKYRYRLYNKLIDQSIEDTWHRVAKAIALPEKKAAQAQWARDFYGILADFKYLPGGRILAGAGTKHTVTLFNCFVMDIAEDSLPAIFTALKEGAITLQQGGGIGYDFSILRPEGDIVQHSGTTASGPISFMRIWDTMCAVLLSTGARRGAMMGVLRCDHPDILKFIHAKKDPNWLRHFNISVFVTDEFMQAVSTNADWPLVFPVNHADVPTSQIVYRTWHGKEMVPCRIYQVVNAREMWQAIIRSAYDYAEPGVLFADTINRRNNLWYDEYISATNPCGEIPLPSYGACNLGAVNLTAFVENAFSELAKINWHALEETVRIATRFQDNVIDASAYPLVQQQREVIATRRIGLGITGLADTFVMLNIQYGSEEAIKLASAIMKCVAETTWQTSIELAQEKDPFPRFSDKYLAGDFVQDLDPSIQKSLAKHGIRNSHHNTIAPTGTISLLANNISNGIEPIFQAQYDRHVLGENERVTFQVQDYVYRLWKENNSQGLPPAWIDINGLTPNAHLLVQAAVQKYIDNAISKTINIPQNFPFDKLNEVYTKAYALGLKGCTIFRPNPITGSVLEAKTCETTQEGDCCPEE